MQQNFEMLKTKEELNNVFYKEDGLKKLLCAQVDGGSDEGPMHEELQNRWLTRGHSNLFIPSTLSGTCMESGHRH